MSRKDTLAALFTQKKAVTPPAAPVGEAERERIRSGAISAMGASLQQLTEGARNAARLQEQIEEGTVVVNLDPALVDSGMVADRLQPEVDPSFDELVASIRDSGQQVPILVRPRDQDQTPRRYQVAYGHRRLRAAQQLGISVKAIVRPLTDAEMVVAQGKENLERRDLSYIEKALFARRLEDAGFERATIVAALSTDKADLSRYISVARLIPEDVAQAIGPAGRVGRARWLLLAENLKRPGASRRLKSVLESEEFRQADSNARFAQVFAALADKAVAEKTSERIWRDQEGRAVVRIESRKDRTVFVVDEAAAPEFSVFLEQEFDTLYARYRQKQAEKSG
ncbi:ParB family chromosome partitioning protein [Pseudochelatococcus lubricantis]|uniref:ParB family chromosome partitioning protein n=1 Tax=Pseudochelatococcus lubricantis TaxID=1538102 RepID=A0ABX0UXS0_9HYPH|nr:plasmid partitioning protein RepB [Pseudochelatococcus lubricantis]NIJ56395.1 ParB family chromosome partitioning protein [Pseudochelatococcus lubricantis]